MKWARAGSFTFVGIFVLSLFTAEYLTIYTPAAGFGFCDSALGGEGRVSSAVCATANCTHFGAFCLKEYSANLCPVSMSYNAYPSPYGKLDSCVTTCFPTSENCQSRKVPYDGPIFWSTCPDR